MRILADENFPVDLVLWLRDQGHDVLFAAADLSGWRDLNLLEIAEERRVRLRWSGVVLFRIHPILVEELRPFVRDVIESTAEFRGQVTVVTRRAVDRIPLSGR